MSFALKTYQRNVLAAIRDFLTQARGAQSEKEVAAAFEAARRAAFGESAPKNVYRRFCAAMPEVPICCLRIPTGGGKTVLAAHSVTIAAEAYVGTDWPLVLWLVPTNTIRTQTYDALSKAGHPYREALEAHFPADRLEIIDIGDCEKLRPEDFGRKAIVVIGTIQTLRVGNTASRDVYAHKESFEPHFAMLPEADFFERITEEDLAEHPYLTARSLGRVKYSFANLLAYYRPIVIVDEAHNAQTSLSIETLQRLRPACILEWTATPADDQNVLISISAQELKAEHMIKLPIVLKPHPNWQEAVRDAVLVRERLAEMARKERLYVRPIVLFQADAKNGEVPVETLKAYLTDSIGIDARRIAVATGSQRELDNVNLFDPTCPIEFVVTVEALKEGWDCSFAYVFATVQNIRSGRDMEQLLGRVLRQPYATPLDSLHLNRAYAHVAAPATVDVANRLTDRLIAMGFEEYEAAVAIEPEGPDLFGDVPAETSGHRPAPAVETTLMMTVDAANALATAAAPGAVTIRREAETCIVKVTGVPSADSIAAAVAAVPAADRAIVERDLKHHQARALEAASPKERGAKLPPVPQLAIPVQGELVLFEPSVVAEIADFSLAGQPADLPGFTPRPDAPGYLIDVEHRRLRIAAEYPSEQIDLNFGQEGIRREDVIRALDRKLQRADVLQADMIAWIGRALDALDARSIPLTYVARHLNEVADAMTARINALAIEARKRTFQQTLFSGKEARPRIAAGFDFEFPADNYPARFHYAGRYVFQKHFYGPPGELDSDITQEETACAIAIDQMEEVEYWVRNLERRGAASFSLPTSTDAFYPDFVAFLKDGRVLVVEYKGAVYFTNEDSREKRDIGRVWAAASEGRGRFVMVTAPSAADNRTVEQQLRDAIR